MPSLLMPNVQTAPAEQDLHLDLTKKYVRLLERRPDGMVSFEFSIGWPELAVELMLPAAAFDEFCSQNKVISRDH